MSATVRAACATVRAAPAPSPQVMPALRIGARTIAGRWRRRTHGRSPFVLLECDPGPGLTGRGTPRRLRRAGADGDPATTEWAGRNPTRPSRIPRSGVG